MHKIEKNEIKFCVVLYTVKLGDRGHGSGWGGWRGARGGGYDGGTGVYGNLWRNSEDSGRHKGKRSST